MEVIDGQVYFGLEVPLSLNEMRVLEIPRVPGTSLQAKPWRAIEIWDRSGRNVGDWIIVVAFPYSIDWEDRARLKMGWKVRKRGDRQRTLWTVAQNSNYREAIENLSRNPFETTEKRVKAILDHPTRSNAEFSAGREKSRSGNCFGICSDLKELTDALEKSPAIIELDHLTQSGELLQKYGSRAWGETAFQRQPSFECIGDPGKLLTADSQGLSRAVENRSLPIGL